MNPALAAHVDFESRSACDLRKSGVYRYAEHPSTWVWVMCWRIGNTGPINRWRPGEADPVALLGHIAGGGLVVAHNASFERTIWNWLIRRRIAPHWPWLHIEQMSCTMARCAAIGIPQGLDYAAQVLGSPYRKDEAGGRVMMKMARPRARLKCDVCEGSGAIMRTFGITHPHDIMMPCATCNSLGETYTWWDDAEHRGKLEAYCDDDVLAETGIDERAPQLSDAERRIWILDQHINDRGVRLDIPTIQKALDLVEHTKKSLDREMIRVTSGAVKTCGQVKKLVEWINAQGVHCESLAKDKREALLDEADELQDEIDLILGAEVEGHSLVREAVELRAQASKSSTAKLKAMLNCVCSDGRARGLLHFHGASTGRWAGRLIQPQNLYRTDPERDGADIKLTISLLQSLPTADAHDMIEAIIGPVMPALAKILRSMFEAEERKKFVGADLANIEGRLQAWFGGEEWKLEAFRAYDAKMGPDLYCVAYGRAFGEDPAAVKKQAGKRQIGKVMELACIAGDQLVLTDKGLIPLDTLTLDHCVWDGIAWVEHEGLVDRGEREVFEWDGLTATADHLVWTEGSTAPVAFGTAAERGARLLRSGLGRQEIRVGGDYQQRTPMGAGVARLPSVDAVHRMLRGTLDSSAQLDIWKVERLPTVQPASSGSYLVGEAPHRSQIEMHQPEGSGLEELRRPRHPVSVLVGAASGLVGSGQPAGGSRAGARSGGQQRALRAGEPAFRRSQYAVLQSAQDEDTREAELAEPVFADHDGPAAAGRIFAGRDHGDGGACGGRASEELARNRRKVRVYDILNAGPRNRFTVSDCLVHNCGYQGSVGSFLNMGKNYNLKPSGLVEPTRSAVPASQWQAQSDAYRKAKDKFGLPQDQWTAIKIIVAGWRGAHPGITQSWWDLQDAAIEAVANPAVVVDVLRGKVRYMAARGFLWCSLPSGKVLAYCNPRVVTQKEIWWEWPDGSHVVLPDGDEAMDAAIDHALKNGAKQKERYKRRVDYDGYDGEKKRWTSFSLYGGMQFNHVVQGTAREVLVGGMLRGEAAGYPMVLTIHDENLTEPVQGFGSAAELERLMTQGEPWLAGCPLAAKGWEDVRYAK